MKTKSKKYQPPKPTTGDTAHLVVSAILSPIPGAGELLERFITPPLQKRLEEWREEIAHALRQLESGKGIDLSELQSNERFISIVLQATTVAIRNHQKEKLIALENVIINSAISTKPDEDLSLIFVRFIDEFTPTHIKLLSFFVREEVALREVKSYTRLYNLFIEQHLTTLSRDEFKMFCGDLEVRGMVRISQDIDDFEDIYQASSLLLESTKDGFPRIIVTDIAKDFFEFIATQKAI